MGFESSADLQLLGGRVLRTDRDAATAELEFDTPADLVQGAGAVQGGAIGAMLEATMSIAASLALRDNQRCETSALNVAFLRGAPKGLYRAHARVDRQGGKLAFAQARLVDREDRLVATAGATLTITAAQ